MGQETLGLNGEAYSPIVLLQQQQLSFCVAERADFILQRGFFALALLNV